MNFFTFFPRVSSMLRFSFSCLNRGVGATRSAGICGRPGSVPGVCERGVRTATPCRKGGGTGRRARAADGHACGKGATNGSASADCGRPCRAGTVPGTGLRAAAAGRFTTLSEVDAISVTFRRAATGQKHNPSLLLGSQAHLVSRSRQRSRQQR